MTLENDVKQHEIKPPFILDFVEGIGHLIKIEDAKTRENKYFFVYIEGEESTKEYAEVIKGIKKLKLPNRKISANPTTNIYNTKTHPELRNHRVYAFPVKNLLNTEKKFKESFLLDYIN